MLTECGLVLERAIRPFSRMNVTEGVRSATDEGIKTDALTQNKEDKHTFTYTHSVLKMKKQK